jgi:hypothetical protein
VSAEVEAWSDAYWVAQDNNRELECWREGEIGLGGERIRMPLPAPNICGGIFCSSNLNKMVSTSKTWVISSNAPQTFTLRCRVPGPWTFYDPTETDARVGMRRLIALPVGSWN